jgi:hypothetical protein
MQKSDKNEANLDVANEGSEDGENYTCIEEYFVDCCRGK